MNLDLKVKIGSRCTRCKGGCIATEARTVHNLVAFRICANCIQYITRDKLQKKTCIKCGKKDLSLQVYKGKERYLCLQCLADAGALIKKHGKKRSVSAYKKKAKKTKAQFKIYR